MKILFVAMQESVHTARWIAQLSQSKWDIHLFPVHNAPLHPALRNITAYGLYSSRPEGSDASVRMRGLLPFRRGTYRLTQAAKRFWPALSQRAGWLARVIRRVRPDVIHSMEFQHSAYLTLEAKHILGDSFPKWVVSNWGSDIYLYRHFPEHLEKIRAVLAECDYYHCECRRDVGLAREYGFKGEEFLVCPGGGGFDVARAMSFRQPGPTSARRTIALKGYQNWAGRALFGLRAMRLCADTIRDGGYRVEIYLPEPESDLAIAARLLEQETGIPVLIVPKNSPHEEILKLHGRSRVSIGLSISDAISTSALEALMLGSFPIQSDTSCFGEWLEEESGSLVPPEDPEAIARALRRALTDDSLVDRAAQANELIARRRLDASGIRPLVVQAYQRIADSLGSS